MLALASVACTARASDDEAFQVRDSAGVRIAESDGPAWGEGEAWRVSGPLVEVGGVEGDERSQLSSPGAIRGGLLLPGGGFVVLDADASTLRAFSEQGVLEWTAGRHGDGPGEFQLAWSLVLLPPDSLLVYDRARATVSIFSADGVFARSFPVQAPAALARSIMSVLVADRTLLAGTGGTTALLAERPRPNTLARERAPMLRIDLDDGAFLDTLGVFPGMEWYATQGAIGLPPFGRMTSYAMTDSTLVVGTADDLSVELRSLEGALVGIARGTGVDLTVTDEDMADYREALLGRASDPGQRDAWARILDAMPRPDQKAAYSSVIADQAGNLWLLETTAGTLLPTRAFLMSPEGRYLGTVAFPGGLRPLHIASDRMLAYRTDELDVPTVGIWAIRR